MSRATRDGRGSRLTERRSHVRGSRISVVVFIKSPPPKAPLAMPHFAYFVDAKEGKQYA